MYICEIYFEEIICKLKEEGNILRNLICNFNNQNIYDAGKDIQSVSTYMSDIYYMNIIIIL